MKRIITLLVFFVCFSINAQDDVRGGTPVKGITTIKKETHSIKNSSLQLGNISTNRLPEDPIGDPIDIDPIDPDPIDPTDPSGGSGLDPSTIVNSTGITKGELSVSLTGSATYTLPVAVPPGIAGTVPQVNLVYNSQGGNGLAGYGWNISGVSAITRIGTTKFHDATIDAVDFDTFDRFAFDGQRLMLKSGVYGAEGAEYQTESFSNVKITSHGVSPFGANYGPAYFLVQYPDGSKAYYGQNVNSRSQTDWAITYWENPIGVRISYEYYLTNNVLAISKIKYGTKNTIPAINEIQFIYKTRQRAEQYYVGGVSFINSNILSQIKVVGNGVGYRNYYLAHNTTSLGYERLISITEKTGDNSKSLNPTIFTYDDLTNDMAFDSTTASFGTSNTNQFNTAIITGDFTGNGLMDFILYPTNGTNAKKELWLFTGINDTNTYNLGYVHNVGSFQDVFPVSWLGGSASYGYKLMPDQAWCVVKANTSSNLVNFSTYSTGTTNPIYFQYSKEYAFPKFTYGYWREPCGNIINNQNDSQSEQQKVVDPNDPNDPVWVSIEKVIPKVFLSGDFNGDGLTDVLTVEKKVTYQVTQNCSTYTQTYQGGKVFFVDLDRRNTTNFINVAGFLTTTDDTKFHVADYNGDGKADILVVNAGNAKVYSLNDNKQLVLQWNIPDADITLATNSPIFLGDYNGDGKMDFMTPKGYGNDFAFFYSTGTSSVKSVKILPFSHNERVPYSNMFDHWDIIPSDINNDGKTDLIQTKFRVNNLGNPQSNFDINVKLYANKNDNFVFILEKDLIPLSTSNTSSCLPIPVFLNPNVQNKNLELGFVYENKIVSTFYNRNFGGEKLLKSITLGNGVKETITYQPLVGDGDLNTENVPVFTPTTYTENYPNFDIKIAPTLNVVTKIEQQSKDAYKKQCFGYYGPVTNVEGMGFLGFRALLRTNWFNDNHDKISNVSKHDLTKRGAVVETYSTLNDTYNFFYTPTTFISKSNINYQEELLPNKVYKIKNTSSTVFNGIEGTSKEVVTSYDNYNNPLQNITYSKLGSTIQKTEKADYIYDNYPSGLPYIIGRAIQKNIEVVYDGNTMTSEEVYAYNGNQLLSQVKKKGTGTNYITEDNVYDAFGNVTQKTITAVGLTPRISNYEYDTTGRFLTKSIDIEGLITNYTYNNSTGQLLTETNPYGLTTTYTYDAWLRKRKVVDYLGNKKTYLFEMTNTTDVKVTTTNDEGSESIIIFDDLGREKISGSKNIDNTWSYVKTSYDIYDRKISVSEPYANLSGTPTQLNTSSFDEYGRLIQTVSYTGKTTNISYSGLTSTMNDGFKTVATTKNAADLTVSMTDDGGTINYQHYPNGNLKQSNYDGVIISVDQDGWGRKTKLTDPSAGIYEYTYNDLGELTWEKTPKGETTYTLNTVGKLTQKEVLGDNTHLISYYNYDGTTKLLTGITTNTSTSYSYEYDTYKRLWRTTEFSPYAHYQMASVFDSFGRVEKEYQHSLHVGTGKSSSKWTKNTYKNGFHWQILDDATSQVLWQTNTVNTRGQLTSATLGNGIAISKTYDNFGFITQSKHDLAGTTPVNVMTLNTTFEPQRGNLTSRYNSMFAWNETFQYDTLDRLTHYTDATGNQVQQIYDNRGRISDNNQGHYNYSGPVYQNSSIDPTPAAFNYYQNRSDLNVTYNAFKSPVEIYEAGFDRISFDYNVFQNRSTMYYGSLEADKLQRKHRKHYATLGALEIKHNTLTNEVEFLTYIGGDGYTAPVVLKSDGTTQNYLYLHRDYLGSIVAITNQSGQVVEKRLFDAWGLLVKVQDGVGNVLTGLVALDRGYTGHEHLQGVNLIHMNGRLYDPLVHRFLQPDNFVQDPYNTQNFNRYGYVLNNPLKYIDITGEWFGVDDLVAGIIGGVINLGVNIWQGNITGNFWQVLGKGAAAFGAGFGGGVLSLYGPGGWVAAGALIGGTNAWLSGTDPVMGVISGGASGLVGGYVGTWASSAINGVFVNGIKIASPLLQGTITGSLAGGFTGGVLGFGFSLVQGNSFEQSLQIGFQGFQIGLATGAVSGGGSASANAIKNNINPINGNDLKPISSEMVKVRHHTSSENMFKIKERGVMFPSRDSGFGSTGIDFENYPTFSGNQNRFSFEPAGKGAFIEMQFPKSVLTTNPSPLHPYHVRLVTNNQNLIITQEFRPRYYINFNF